MNLKAVWGRGASLCGLIVMSESKHDTFHWGPFALPTEGVWSYLLIWPIRAKLFTGNILYFEWSNIVTVPKISQKFWLTEREICYCCQQKLVILQKQKHLSVHNRNKKCYCYQQKVQLVSYFNAKLMKCVLLSKLNRTCPKSPCTGRAISHCSVCYSLSLPLSFFCNRNRTETERGTGTETEQKIRLSMTKNKTQPDA